MTKTCLNEKMSEDFLKHIRELLKSSDFSDVTIVSDDQKIFKGHRNILSGFSPVLKNLFKVESQYHPALLYLNGINSSEINAIMEFIYGNTIPKTWTEHLQSAVISLKIKGLQEQVPVVKTDLPSLPEIKIEKTSSLRRVLFSEPNNKDESDEDFVKISLLNPRKERNSSLPVLSETSSKLFESDINYEEPFSVEEEESYQQKFSVSSTERHENTLLITEMGTVGNMRGESTEEAKTDISGTFSRMQNTKGTKFKVKLSDLVERRFQQPSPNFLKKFNESNKKLKAQSSLNASNKNTTKRACDQCSPVIQFTSDYELRKHLKSWHNIGPFKCELCNYIALQHSKLQEHINKKHLGIKEDTPCDQCDYNPKDQRNLLKHIKSKHEGVRYPCHLCEYKATYRQSLKDHITSIHEGFKCQCPFCGKQLSSPHCLHMHIKHTHEGRKYKCEFCEYHATRKSNLLVHFQKMHKDINIEIFREKMNAKNLLRLPRNERNLDTTPRKTID